MPTLSISEEEVLRLCRLDEADVDLVAEVATLLADEQEAVEATITAAALADATLTALLRRNVAKLLAAGYLEMRGREEGATGSFQGAGLSLGPAKFDFVTRLREEADAALRPYRRLGATVAASGIATASPASLTAQNAMFGRSEGDRLREVED